MQYPLVFRVLVAHMLCSLPSDPHPDAPVAELHDLFCKKLQQCCVMFDFLDCVADLKGKEIKRAALNELVESVATSRGVLIEPLYPEAIKMVRVKKKIQVLVLNCCTKSWQAIGGTCRLRLVGSIVCFPHVFTSFLKESPGCMTKHAANRRKGADFGARWGGFPSLVLQVAGGNAFVE